MAVREGLDLYSTQYWMSTQDTKIDLYWIVRNEAVRSILVNSHISYNSILSGSTGGTWFVGDIICCHHLSYRYYMLTFFRYYKRITDAKYKHMSCWHPTFISFLTDFLIDLSNTDLYFFSHNAIYGRRMLFYINVTAKKKEFFHKYPSYTGAAQSF